jgi:small-conductance mechanosensitive channel
MPQDADSSSVRFEPLHPASRSAVIVGVVVGPLLWLVAIVAVALFFEYTWAIALGLLVTVATFLVALAVLALFRVARIRQERRYVDAG